MILIDTNVISEVMRAEPDAKVKAWLNDQMRGEVGITAITVTEVLYGIISLDIMTLRGEHRWISQKKPDGW